MTPTYLLGLEVRGFLFALTALVAMRLLTGAMPLKGLLGNEDGTDDISPERLQLLLATMALAGKMVVSAVHGAAGTMQDIGPQWLYLFGGSSGIYASVKMGRSLINRR
jgi:hypothetical protein